MGRRSGLLGWWEVEGYCFEIDLCIADERGEQRHMIPRYSIPRNVIDGYRIRNVAIERLGRDVDCW